MFNNYKYDQLNRLTRQDVFTGFDRSNNHYNGLAASVHFRERVSYDANGNIQTYFRNTAGYQPEIDSLYYQYYAGTNKLRRVRDSVDANKMGSNSWEVIMDIDDQPEVDNYEYDAIGNLVKDKAESITGIQWNVYGKITEITRTANAKVPITRIRYTYDPSGNRIGKVVDKSGTTAKDFTWYVRDAQSLPRSAGAI